MSENSGNGYVSLSLAAPEFGPRKQRFLHLAEVAEGAGFEPAIEFPLYTLSRRAPSTTRPPLHAAQGNEA
jgi:hypothetical protein